jgi:hypothetical protein
MRGTAERDSRVSFERLGVGSDEYDCFVVVRRRSDGATASLSQTVRLYDDGRFVSVVSINNVTIPRLGYNGDFLHEVMRAAFAPDELQETGT